MSALIASSPWHLVVLDVVLVLCYAPEWIGSFFQNPEPGAVRRDRGSYMVLLLGLFVGIAVAFGAAFALPGASITGFPEAWFWTGIALMLAGTAFRWYAIRVLGRFFTRSVATRAGQYVVATGPYRLIRHPSYAGALVALLGMGFALTNWVSLAVIVLGMLVGYGWRVHVEEQALCAALGQPYRDYMQRTRRFVPYLW